MKNIWVVEIYTGRYKGWMTTWVVGLTFSQTRTIAREKLIKYKQQFPASKFRVIKYVPTILDSKL